MLCWFHLCIIVLIMNRLKQMQANIISLVNAWSCKGIFYFSVTGEQTSKHYYYQHWCTLVQVLIEKNPASQKDSRKV